MKLVPATPDLRNWPEVTLRGRTFRLPLPVAGERGFHVCPPATPDECAECVSRREAQDKKLVAVMMRERGLPTCMRRVEVRLWEQ